MQNEKLQLSRKEEFRKDLTRGEETMKREQKQSGEMRWEVSQYV